MTAKLSRPLAIAALLTLAATAQAGTALDADFEGMTPDETIGTGGPALGEPIALYNCVTTVRSAPLPSTCLEFDDETDYGSGYATFEFLDDIEIMSGTVEISATLWFAEQNGYLFSVREHGHNAAQLTSITISGNGNVYVNDANGSLGDVAVYDLGRAIELRIEHDLDAGTYDLWWDGALVVDDRAHGVTEYGIGRLLIGINHDPDLDGLFYMDDLLVEASIITANSAESWGTVKATWR